jgi:hypothetical protein
MIVKRELLWELLRILLLFLRSVNIGGDLHEHLFTGTSTDQNYCEHMFILQEWREIYTNTCSRQRVLDREINMNKWSPQSA